MEACPLYKSTSCARLRTTKLSMASSLGKWRVNPLISLWTELVRAGFGKMEAGPLYKSTSCARLRTTKLSMASSLGKWRVNPLISFWTELVRAGFGKMELLGGHLPCQLICTVTLPMDWAWKTILKWPLICWNPSSGGKVMERSSSRSADLYINLTIGLGMKNYPKLTHHLLKYIKWLPSYGEVFINVSWCVYWPHHWIWHEKLPQIDPSYVEIRPLVAKL